MKLNVNPKNSYTFVLHPSHKKLNETIKSVFLLILATFAMVFSSCDGVLFETKEEITIQIYDTYVEEEITKGTTIAPNHGCLIFKAPEDSPIEMPLSFELSIDINGTAYTETLSQGQTVVINNIPAGKIYPVKCSAMTPDGGVFAAGSADAKMTAGKINPLDLVMTRMDGGSDPLPTTVTVTFNSNGGSSVAPQTFTRGGKATRPEDPTKEQTTFLGWFEDLTNENAFDFNTEINSDITLYAKWEGITGSEVFIDGRSITIRSTVWASDHEVTQAEYQVVMGTNPSGFSSSPADGETQENRPVEKVSWYDCLVYCNKRSLAEGLTPCYTVKGNTNPTDWGSVPTSSNSDWNAATCNFDANGYRLPTEAEWEYLARGGNMTNSGQTTYSGSDTIGDVAWYTENSGIKTHEVKKKSQNVLGLYDMSGNVWELCWDRYGNITVDTPSVGVSSGSYRVLRGGGWSSYANECAVSHRGHYNPSGRDYTIGFRVVRSIAD